ncbi:hypothetical protein [Pseudomonas sp.]|uniref:hypothetical protein n=1 Tax=Pseudomonas sp. TaxID=306 RepID=UPI0027B8CA34|nr:hypothetical protein [Pseudomonas sp.]
MATVAMLAALTGVEPQLRAHMRMGMNTGLTAGQLRQAGRVLAERVSPEAALRAEQALASQLASL